MERGDKLHTWLKGLGYNGKNPQEIRNIYNPSTYFVWELLMEKIQSKQEVEFSHRNVIINRLKSKSFKQQKNYPYPIEEISLYQKKINLEAEIQHYTAEGIKSQHEVLRSSNENNTNYMVKENLKQRVKECRERTCILNRKCKQLSSDVKKSEDVLQSVKNQTPVELNEDDDPQVIIETLTKCSEKLEKLISENNSSLQGVLRKQENFSVKKREFWSSVKKNHTRSARKGAISTAARELSYGGSDEPESFLKSRKNYIPTVLTVKPIEEDVVTDTTMKRKDRDSLGLLPYSCIESTSSTNNFLNVPVTFKTPINTPAKHNHKMVPQTVEKSSNILKASFTGTSVLKIGYQNLYQDKFILENVRDLLHNHNRPYIWKFVQNALNKMISETQSMVLEYKTCADTGRLKIDEKDIAKLQWLQIKTELEVLKYKAYNNNLKHKIESMRIRISRTILNPMNQLRKQSEMDRLFDLQIQERGLDAKIALLKKEIGSSYKKLSSSNDLQVTKNKITQTKEDIAFKLAIIEACITEISKSLDYLNLTKDSTACSVRKLNVFISDLQWAVPLLDSIFSNEIEMFYNFPIEYNRRFVNTKSNMYYHDLHLTTYLNTEIDHKTLSMISMLLESPFSEPQYVQDNILNYKSKLDVMKCLERTGNVEGSCKYSAEELIQIESYISSALADLSQYAFTSKRVAEFIRKMRQVIEVWQEMPFNNFVSPARLIDGQSFTYYKKKFDNLYVHL